MVCEVSMVSIIFMYVVLLLCCNVCLLCSARDTLTHADPLTDDGSATLVSAEGTFELGFFNLPGSHGRFVGIWYHKLAPKTAVWIFNRENPVPAGVTGRLTINEGKLCLLDSFSGETIFPTLIGVASSFNMIVKLMETGNLVLMDSDQKAAKTLWQSFANPTDTFIPGMVMDDSFQLTSWRSENDPGGGNFSFKRDQDENQYIILKNNLIPYWKSGESGNKFSSDEMSPKVHFLLSISSRNYTYDVGLRIFNYTRLVMKYTGQLQFLTWDDKQWLVSWLEPKDQCSVFNPCGNFGSCNKNNWPFVCKCLPGFRPTSYKEWNSGDFSSGCQRETTLSSNSSTILRLTMMKVKEADVQSKLGNETECSNACLENPRCQAYSYGVVTENIRKRATNSTTTSNTFCWTWSEDLNNLVEEYDSGRNVSVRVALSDIESTVRDCKPCGTTMIPYPLSTGPDCGDPTYFSFNCNNLTGQVSFTEPKNAFRVIRIDPSSRKFVLQGLLAKGLPAKGLGGCDPTARGKTLQLSPLSRFRIVSWCQADLGDISSEALSSRYLNVVELSWELPPQPICNTPEDCKDLPNSTCKIAVENQRKRCFCDIGSWSGTNFSCTQVGSLQEPSQPSSGENSDRKVRFYLIIVAGPIGMILLACVASIYIWGRTMRKKQDKINREQFDSERRVLELIDTSEFNKEDEKGIDVPFFDFQSILEATENFSEANKLGQGGYGPVYKGKFHGDQEIAVKRLSKVSGQGLQEFRNEVVLIAKLQHRNLVRLKGYCMKGEEKILLYEYMPNKSLDSFIFDHRKSVCLNWEMRYNIILGVARGLLYLHQDSRLRIVHRDLKTSNVLLDEEMNPKISDFGLARIVGGKETGANTNTVVGTYGYMSPEYALDGTFSIKSDVFSFGVVLLEIISGRKNAGFYQSKQTFSLICHAWELWTEDKVLDLIDKNLQESCDRSEFIKCVNVALLCVQEDPVDRPTMSNVITLLDSEAAIPATPKQPAFFIRRGSSSSGSASTSTKPEAVSEITTLEGR